MNQVGEHNEKTLDKIRIHPEGWKTFLDEPGISSSTGAAWHRIYSWELSIVFDRTRHYSRVTTLRKGGNLVRRL